MAALSLTIKKTLKKMKTETEKTEKPSKKIKIKFLLSPTGRFNLGYNVGETAEMDEKQAIELIEAKYAKKVK